MCKMSLSWGSFTDVIVLAIEKTANLASQISSCKQLEQEVLNAVTYVFPTKNGFISRIYI